ncbi:unnamed protein product [Brassica rapa]|uniref:Uncharacterized protein n=1 Tax=Brassica campestris TaxID=3711 RepID=A0A3P5ZA65_BRACM|nr:unnamed protein product [Brassica rapa]VDC70983.1 unnamed protein product [Brassica rapa]
MSMFRRLFCFFSRKKKKTPSSNLSPPRVKKVKPRKKDGGFSVVTSGPNTISNTKGCCCRGGSGCGGGCGGCGG